MAELLHSENSSVSKEEYHFCEILTECFRKSFADCLEQINNQKKTEVDASESKQLKTKRGVEDEIILPIPGYVIKTKTNRENVFINICYIDLVSSAKLKFAERYEKVCSSYITYFLSHPKRHLIDCSNLYVVCDVVFHRTISELEEFKQYINSIALDNIEKIFNINLDRNYVEIPKAKYVGIPERIVVGKFIQGCSYFPENIKTGYEIEDDGDQTLFGKILIANEASCENAKYCNKHATGVYLQKLNNENSGCMHNPVLAQSAINVHLPFPHAINMDFGEKIVSTLSQNPLEYHLNVILPYPLKENCFEIVLDRRSVPNIITIPVRVENYQIVLNSMLLSHEDSGIDSDIGSPDSTNAQKYANSLISVNSFFDLNCSYIFPSFNISALGNIIMLTLNIKNAVTDSLQYVTVKNCLGLKCFSVNGGLHPLHYAFLLKIDSDISNIQVEIWDNNVTLQFTTNSDVALSLSSKQEMQPDGMEISQDECRDNSSKFISKCKTKTSTGFSQAINCPDLKLDTTIKEKTARGNALEANKIRSISESSEDNPSILKRRGILKFGSISRSVSESSVDDHFGFSVSFDHDVNGSSVEIASSSLDPCKENDITCKKTVRFKEVVSKQVFRSNSSILGQKKKNQRKNRNKKRAHGRKLSESENSEGEDKDISTENVNGMSTNKELQELSSALQELELNKENTNCSAFRNDLIFQIDM